MNNVAFEDISNLFREIKPDCGDIRPESSLYLDLQFDSIQIIELICMIEDKYGTIFPIDELEKIDSVDDIVNLLKQRVERITNEVL